LSGPHSRSIRPATRLAHSPNADGSTPFSDRRPLSRSTLMQVRFRKHERIEKPCAKVTARLLIRIWGKYARFTEGPTCHSDSHEHSYGGHTGFSFVGKSQRSLCQRHVARLPVVWEARTHGLPHRTDGAAVGTMPGQSRRMVHPYQSDQCSGRVQEIGRIHQVGVGLVPTHAKLRPRRPRLTSPLWCLS
jgi:hypothetical protein